MKKIILFFVIPFLPLVSHTVQKSTPKPVNSSMASEKLPGIFTSIYHSDAYWGSKETVSGCGSTLDFTKAIREKIPPLIKRLKIKTILDIPCGDFNWMKEVKLNVDQYIGADIVVELVKRNNALYEKPDRTFIHLDVTKDTLPKADIILCRDCLIHLSFDNIFKAILNFKKSGAKYLLVSTHFKIEKNKDINDGEYRPLNLQLPPFNFPNPIVVICESYFQEAGKSLALWKLSRIRANFDIN